MLSHEINSKDCQVLYHFRVLILLMYLFFNGSIHNDAGIIPVFYVEFRTLFLLNLKIGIFDQLQYK